MATSTWFGLAVISDSFYWASNHRLFALLFFFRGLWLFENEVMVTAWSLFKVFGCGL
jgi:hypothetical protein